MTRHRSPTPTNPRTIKRLSWAISILLLVSLSGLAMHYGDAIGTSLSPNLPQPFNGSPAPARTPADTSPGPLVLPSIGPPSLPNDDVLGVDPLEAPQTAADASTGDTEGSTPEQPIAGSEGVSAPRC